MRKRNFYLKKLPEPRLYFQASVFLEILIYHQLAPVPGLYHDEVLPFDYLLFFELGFASIIILAISALKSARIPQKPKPLLS